MKAKTNQSRQADFKARQAKAGLVRVEVWIPEDRKVELISYVESLKSVGHS